MEFLKERSGSGIVRLEGELNIQDAVRLKETLAEAFAHAKTLSLDLSGMTGIDVACMQVLCSAHKTFMRSNKSFAVQGRGTTSFERSVKDGGYTRTSGCHEDKKCTCLWLIGGRNE